MPKEVIEEVMRGDEERVQESIRTNLKVVWKFMDEGDVEAWG